jgi:NHL repeat
VFLSVSVFAALLTAGGALVSAASAAARGAPSVAGTISTIAGGVGGPGPGTKVSVALPCGVSFAAGHLYISQGVVREVGAATGRLTTPAGAAEIASPPASGVPAAKVNLAACGTASDKAGNLVIADRGANAVRVAAASTGTFYGQQMTAGNIYTVAGNGTAGFSGDGGPAAQAELNFPQAVAVDGFGNLVVADEDNNCVRVIAASTGTFYGQQMTAGNIYTVAGDGTHAHTGDGGPATSAAINGPPGLAVDAAGNLVLSDSAYPSSLSGSLRVVAVHSGTFYGKQMTAGDIYAITPSGLYAPQGLTVDSHGNVVIAVFGFSEVAVFADHTGTFYGQQMSADHLYTIAGGGQSLKNGVPALKALLQGPESVALDGAGNLVIADTFHSLVRVVAYHSGTFYGQPMTNGDIYTVAGNGNEGSSGDLGSATMAELRPGGVAQDHAGNLVATDSGGAEVRVVPPVSGTFYGQQMSAGHIYTIAGGGGSYPGDGGPATSGEFANPAGLVIDRAGNLLVADYYGERIRMVAVKSGTFYGQQMTAGDIYTVAGNGQTFFHGDGGPAVDAQINSPQAVAVDGAGNLVLTDTANHRVRVVAAHSGTFYGQQMTVGDIYTVAGDGRVKFNGNGQPATQSGIASPQGVAVDGGGNLVIDDAMNNRVRVVAASTGTFYGQQMTVGDMYTVAGDGTAGYSGNGGPARSAELNVPANVSVDGAGNLLVADELNQRVRVIAVTTGTFYGQQMTAGHIYTVAGGGGSIGDGGPATTAELIFPQDAIAAGHGGLLIADHSIEGRVRLVSG